MLYSILIVRFDLECFTTTYLHTHTHTQTHVTHPLDVISIQNLQTTNKNQQMKTIMIMMKTENRQNE